MVDKDKNEDYEVVDTENYMGATGNIGFSHEVLVMTSMLKVIEIGKMEMKAGYFNTRVDRQGNVHRQYIDDTRKSFIEAVKNVLMVMSPDIDDEANKNLKKLFEKDRNAYQRLCNEEEDYWNKMLIERKRTFINQGIYYREGYLNKELPFSQEYIEIQVDIYRDIFSELSKLTKRLNYFKVEPFQETWMMERAIQEGKEV